MKRKTILGIFLVLAFGLSMIMVPNAAAMEIKDNRAPRPGGGGGGRWRNTAPVVSITNPSNFAVVAGTVTITATATDAEDGAMVPTIKIDGVTVGTTSYVWDTTTAAEGSHSISASATDSGGLTGSATVSVTVDNVEDPPPVPGEDKYVVIVGVSDYDAISDLTYCDEDATDWFNYFTALDYEIVLLGDHSNSFPQFDGLATEYNVKAALANMVATADGDDTIAYVSSGHGTTYSGGETICLWDYGAGQNGEDGSFTDVELAVVFAPAVSDVFIFLDHCYSGGMNEVMSNANGGNIYLTTTCTDEGYGYDVSTYANGAWTYWFLEAGLIGQGFTSMELCFDWALANYPYASKDRDVPQEFDGNPLEAFTL